MIRGRRHFLHSRYACGYTSFVVSVVSNDGFQEVLSWGTSDPSIAEEEIVKVVERYSDEIVEQWNKEIDGLLTFVRFRVIRYDSSHSFIE